MCEAFLRLEDKNLDPLTFSQGDVVDLFDDGKFPDQVAYPHAVIKIPGYPKENLEFVLEPYKVTNPETQMVEIQQLREWYVDADIIDLALVTELRTNRYITVNASLINSSIRNRISGEIYNG